MSDNNDEILSFASEDDSSKSLEKGKKRTAWKLIIADDDKEVHAVSNLTLSNFSFNGLPLDIINVYSADETKKVILDNPDSAMILLDVVMEDHDSGLKLVKFIRETANNSLIRIILRTGQPGFAPELTVITDYDINDYKGKTELTSAKLVTTIIASLRNYDDLRKIEKHRQNLELIASSSAEMHGLESTIPLNDTIHETLDELVKRFSEHSDSNVSILNGFIEGGDLLIEKGSGEYSDLEGKKELKTIIPQFIYNKINDTQAQDNIFFHKKECTIFLKTVRGTTRLIHIKKIPELSELEKSILITFCNNLITIYNNVDLMEEQKKTEKQIRNSLAEKQILVKEIHHRVKNNLQIIISLLHMQSSGIENEQLLAIIKESENRVQSMSLVHEKLYQSEMMATINFNEYIRSLAERLISSYGVLNQIKLTLDTAPVMLSINTAIPCGLILNEILTNSMKYAFPDNKEGEITIRMNTKDEDVILSISDNGVGIPQDMDKSKIKSLGLKLIQVLTSQIDGNVEIENNNGTTFKLTFPISEERE